MRHAGNAHELFEVAGDELRPIVRDESRRGAGMQLASSLQDRLYVGFSHGFADLPVHDSAAEPIEARGAVP